MATDTLADVFSAPAETAPRAHRGQRSRLLPPPIPGGTAAGWLGPVAVMLFALALRLHRLSIPAKQAFDEVYYRCDAWSLVQFGYERSHDETCTSFTAEPAYIVHPPLGKWLIGFGEKLFGFDSFGWRISAAVFGALSVLILCRLGRRMFRSTLLGCFAGFLLALDGLHFVQSRVAMLDIFLMFFVLAAAACLVVDRDDLRTRLAARLEGDLSYPGPKLGLRPWQLAAGACLGAALAVKWSALYYVAVFGLVAFAWEIGARRTAGVPAPLRATIWRAGVPLAVSLLAVPVVVYVASWSGWFFTHGAWRRDCGGQFPTNCGAFFGWFEYHKEMWRFHTELHADHPYASKPWGWLLLARPVSYFYTAPEPGTSKEILAIGTPAIWWPSIVALLVSAVRWATRRDWRAGFILAGFLAGYVPWFWPADRTEFLFYALPAVPFFCLALAYCAGLLLGTRSAAAAPGRGLLRPRRWAAWVVGGYALLVVVNFFFFYPVLSAKVLPYEKWNDRIWFSSWI